MLERVITVFFVMVVGAQLVSGGYLRNPNEHTSIRWSPIATHVDFNAWVPGLAFNHDAMPPQSSIRVATMDGELAVDVDERARDHDARPVPVTSGTMPDPKDSQEGLLPQAFYVHDAQGNLQARQYDPVFLAAVRNQELHRSPFITKVQPQINPGANDPTV